MKTLAAGTKAPTTGYYLNVAKWDFTHVARGAALPDEGSFLRLPLPIVLGLAPVLGLLMVMFLPFIGFALTIGLVAKKTAESVQQMFFGLAAVVHPAWRPGEAYLTGKRAGKDGEAKADEKLDSLAGEITSRRNEKK